MYKIAIIVFPDAEELDVVGPYETIASLDKIEPGSVEVDLVAESLEPVKFFNGLRVLPDKTFFLDEQYDILIVPGGDGRKEAMYDDTVHDFLKEQSDGLLYICSVCTGAFVLAEAGILDGLKATTHRSALEELTHSYPEITVKDERVVKNETDPQVWTAAGISSGIDLALELIGELFSEEVRDTVARRLEYPYNR